MLMAKPACGARKPIKNQEGQGMLDIDENPSVEDDMFENVKTDEDMDHEMEEEEGGSAFEEEIDPDESDQQEQAVIPKSQTPFLSDKDTPESYGELIGFMEKFIEDQKAENDAFRKEVKDSLSSTATDFKQRTDLILDEMKSIQSDMKREASATRRAQNSLSKMVASFEQGDKYAETVTKAVTDGATQAVEETVQAGTKAIDEVAKKSAKSIEKLEQAANARAKRFMRMPSVPSMPPRLMSPPSSRASRMPRPSLMRRNRTSMPPTRQSIRQSRPSSRSRSPLMLPTQP